MHLSDLLSMWRSPRLVAWFLSGSFLLVAATLPFSFCPLIAGVADLRPGAALVPLLGIFGGPAGVWAAFAGTLTGDLLTSTWESLVPFRALGAAIAAWIAQRLWDPGPATSSVPAHSSCARVFRFMCCALPSIFAYSAWPALAGAMDHLYPFPYLLLLYGGGDLLFLLALGLPLFHIVIRSERLAGEPWQHALARSSSKDALPWWGILSPWLGGLGAWILGPLTAGWVYGTWPWHRYIVGTRDGGWSWFVVLFCLLVQVAGLLPRPRQGAPGGGTSQSRFGNTLLPPILRR